MGSNPPPLGLFIPWGSAAASASTRGLRWQSVPVPFGSFPCPSHQSVPHRAQPGAPLGAAQGAVGGCPNSLLSGFVCKPPTGHLQPQPPVQPALSLRSRQRPQDFFPKPAAVWENIRCRRWHGRCPGVHAAVPAVTHPPAAGSELARSPLPPVRGLRSSLIKNNSSDLLCPCV